MSGTSDDFDIQFANWRWFAVHQMELQKAVDAFHQRTGRYTRTLADLRGEMQFEHLAFEQWRDPWGQPFTYKFFIEGPRFVIECESRGDPNQKSQNYYGDGLFTVGSAFIDYTKDLQKKIDIALNRYVQTHPFPNNDAQFQAALRAGGVPASLLTDAWHQALYATFRSHSFFTDRVVTEAHATPTSGPEVRTTVTPVTAISDVIDLHSRGPVVGKKHNEFLIASFSHVRSTQSAKDATAGRPSRQAVFNGPAGDISGTVSDPSGAVIPGVSVIATNTATKAEFEQKSDENGAFLIGPVPAGSYKVRFYLSGFNDLVYDEVNVLARNTVTLDAKLNVGSEATTVEVTAAKVELQTMNASMGATVTRGLLHIAAVPMRPLDGFTGDQAQGGAEVDRNSTPARLLPGNPALAARDHHRRGWHGNSPLPGSGQHHYVAALGRGVHAGREHRLRDRAVPDVSAVLRGVRPALRAHHRRHDRAADHVA